MDMFSSIQNSLFLELIADIINQTVNKSFLFQRSVMGILNDIYRTPRHTHALWCIWFFVITYTSRAK